MIGKGTLSPALRAPGSDDALREEDVVKQVEGVRKNGSRLPTIMGIPKLGRV